jgi:hypothetical protein
MSTTPDTDDDTDGDTDDVWAEVAEYRPTLEMFVERDLPLAEQAQQLLDRLDKEGYD